MDIKKIINFIKMTNRFRAVTRHTNIITEKRKENDAEHSYQLVMVAWYIASSEDIPLNKDLILKYALIHDLVEVYAGDTCFYRTEEESKRKEKQEVESRSRLAKEFPDFPDMHDLIRRYEIREDPESRFVYALDKLLPIISHYMNKGLEWKEDRIAYKDIWNGKKDKILISPELEPYFEQIMEILAKNKHMFHEKQKRD